MKKQLFILFALLAIGFNTFAGTPEKVIEQYITLSGLSAAISQIDELRDAKIAEKKDSFNSPQEFQQFSTTMTNTLNGEKMLENIKKYLGQQSDKKTLKSYIKFHETPLIQKVMEEELKANDPAQQQDMIAYFQAFESDPPSQERIQQLIKLDETARLSENMTSILKNMMTSILSGVNAQLPAEDRLSEAEISSNLKAMFPANFEQKIKEQVIMMSLYSYRNITDQEMNQYIDLWASPLAQQDLALTFASLNYAFTNINMTFEEKGQ
ncbi:hypothetical protein [Persicobacter psychrovividus]|uniref:DUF2059 domain-containing protein n=1 Tax=Persicobacter psychrovividus TaxID=387638 RepID=A0ABM7VD65_9BACT|nr:hypothetical protein PEPS_11530 [Persicobacter psychrovividus]